MSLSDAGELAFEHDLGVAPPVLWRVFANRNWNDRTIQHVNWFVTEEAARKHAAWINDGRGKVLAVSRYVLENLSGNQ